MQEDQRWGKGDVLPVGVLFGAIVIFLLFSVAIASPSYVKSRGGSPRYKSCVANMKQIESAKEEFAAKYHLPAGAPLPEGCLWAKGSYIRSEPECPSGGTYTVGVLGELPKCSVGGKHSLE
jgi:hypothetical protein